MSDTGLPLENEIIEEKDEHEEEEEKRKTMTDFKKGSEAINNTAP